jgi:5,10-methylenetetrahydrofolate reductase
MRKKSKTASFAQKIKNGEHTILYELLPLPKSLSEEDLHRSFSLFSATINHYRVDAVNIPEVREETRSGTRDTTIEKLEPRIVCSYLQKYTDCELIINRPIVYLPWEEQKQWIEETRQQYGIHNFVLVGGESSKMKYPGLSVIDAAKKITVAYPQIILGGIVIPTRHAEEERVLQKSIAGVTFFTTQIIYEPESPKQFLQKYWELCQKEQVAPKMIFLSFAPLTTNADLNLLKWLGVGIPQETQDLLTTGWLGLGWRSLQICQDILEDILDFVEKEHIGVPIGLNVEHINRHNYESSFSLLERLNTIYGKLTPIERRHALYV